jgi:DNA integrity scanning protein DisA with diadenylate cyclase activity
MAVGLIAVVVLFQPEIRRMLDHLGSVRLKRFLGTEKQEQEMFSVISQTVLACETMSRERVGALIVFERDSRLDEYFKTGTMIDGKLSDPMIRNLFFPKAALHDGAIVVRNGRIAAASCVLPLSNSARLSADLGTRHRAGVGLSEITDAVVVIVSEETGTRIDGQVSEQLIRNIFFPMASLHDGAMIIRDGRVAAAGCVLPLSDSSRLSADLGTRHRAGVGISEVSDSVAIIVSEETGTISVAVGGMLKRHLAPQTLERLLHNELCPEENAGEDNLVVRLRQKLNKKGEEKSK